ncbi:hypothetical protein [Streptomyces sp. NPDC093992]|uniref:hypothetical protein n=1 Tax=Streptomyces sp. NPDC093992 TaxID=3366053 RepID=UPI0038393B48
MVATCWARGRLAVVRGRAHRATAAGPVLPPPFESERGGHTADLVVTAEPVDAA